MLRQREARTPEECRRVAALLKERIQAIDRKLAELRAFRRRLAGSLEQCERADSGACPVILDFTSLAAKPRKES